MANPHSDEETLATFLHISDMHIGELDHRTGNAKISPSVRKASSNNLPLVDGLLGHHGRALEDLQTLVRTLKRKDPELQLIVSGDLTSFGGPAELDLARRFIETQIDLRPPQQFMVGLRMGKTPLLISGNHDHWSGMHHPFGRGRSHYYPMFPAMPFTHNVDLTKARKRIAFISIDSDEDVIKPSVRLKYKVPAIGDFLKPLGWLDSTLSAQKSNEIRILLIHHSWYQQGPVLQMSQRSKTALEEFMCSHGICAMLCGHSHHTLLGRFEASSPGAVRDVREMRAGSASQLDVVPIDWLNILGRRPVKDWRANAVLVHRICQTRRGLQWQAETYVRDRFGFGLLQGKGMKFRLT